ncbi:ATP-binding protein [Kocuria soli]|uniref:ATP-binding protein n=1 Tax=Kocuria soli TaxID=2485125 RepID=A0A3N4A0N7_9MICC|nr:ATP-binding protein [Kocuria soli]ROZ65664.1 ATP-binding protein [Kocuria soli]
MSHSSSPPQLNYKRVPSRLRRSGLPSTTSPAALGPYAYRLFWLAEICVAGFSFSLIIGSLPRLHQTGAGASSWSLAFLLAHLVNTVVMLFFGVQRKVVVWPLTVIATLSLLAVLLMPVTVPHDAAALQPWLPSFFMVASMAVVFVWGLTTALVYAAVSTGLYVVFRIALTDQFADVHSVAQLIARLGFMVVAIALMATIRRVADNADEAYNDALAQATALKRSHSQAEDQERLDRLIHDNVMAALLDASRTTGVVSRQTKELAQRALGVLAFEEKRASGTATTLVHLLEDELLEALTPWRARVRFTSLTLSIRPDGQPRAFLSTEIAQALVQAVTEAVANSARHSGSEITYVTMGGSSCPPTRLNPQGFYLNFEVQDNGRGFQMRAMDERRLGVRVSIIGNVQNVGGAVQIHSLPHRGTRVSITWPRDAKLPQ